MREYNMNVMRKLISQDPILNNVLELHSEIYHNIEDGYKDLYTVIKNKPDYVQTYNNLF